ncbi:MAG: tryptophan-rich sensory protein [Salibacteraceae bacterium]
MKTKRMGTCLFKERKIHFHIKIKTMIYRLVIFLVINFGALALGGFFTGRGVSSEWYLGLSKAPWTPPGWVFGFSWTTIMICFSFYMAGLWPQVANGKVLAILFSTQWILNVGWNPVFFYFHHVGLGLAIISLLSILVAAIFVLYWPEMRYKSMLLLPYIIWLLIATSLNGYIVFKN